MIILYFPFFWIWILFKLLSCKPTVVHACDLDTVIPAYIYKLLFRKKLIFDVFDRYAMAYIPPKYHILYSIVNLLEEFVARRADMLVTVSLKLQSTFKSLRDYCIIMNCPEDSFAEKQHVQNDVFTLVYTGAIVRNRGLERMTAAIKGVSGVELVIAGRVIDKALLDQILGSSNIRYKGLLSPEYALLLEADSDAMVILYDLKDPINNFAMPNKLFEAMMFGLPVIANVAEEVIKAVDCGIVVDYNDIDQIRDAVISIRDDSELRRHFRTNSRKAFLQKYSWTIMEKELYRIYENLVVS